MAGACAAGTCSGGVAAGGCGGPGGCGNGGGCVSLFIQMSQFYSEADFDHRVVVARLEAAAEEVVDVGEVEDAGVVVDDRKCVIINE